MIKVTIEWDTPDDVGVLRVAGAREYIHEKFDYILEDVSKQVRVPMPGRVVIATLPEMAILYAGHRQ